VKALLSAILGSNQHLVGVSSAILVAALGLAGISGFGLWWLLAIPAYLFGFSLGTMFWGFPSPRELTNKDFARDCMEKLGRLRTSVIRDFGADSRSDAALSLLQLLDRIAELLKGMNRSSVTEDDTSVFVIDRLLTQFLPEAVGSYLAIPEFGRNREVTDQFIENIAIIKAEIIEMESSFADKNIEKFMAHSYFIEERFRKTAPKHNRDSIPNMN